jgi:uncharacterized membrane protein HdeD (DUF308 family)
MSGLQELRRNWGWLLVWGLCLVVTGSLAMVFSFISTLATVLAFGILLLVGGGVHVLSAFSARRWGGSFLHLLQGVLFIVAGVLVIEAPVAAAAGLTLVLAAAFLAGGLCRIIAALAQRFPNWGWVLLSGVVALVLGVFIWRHWPEDSWQFIGLFIGIEMLFSGWSWVTLALMLRALPRAGEGGAAV